MIVNGPDPIKELAHCRMMLQSQQRLLAEVRWGNSSAKPYEAEVLRWLDRVWDAQVAAHSHLCAAVSPQVGIINGQKWARI